MTKDWTPLPGATGPDHIFCIGDVHGELDSLKAALAEIDKLEKHGNVRIIFLGDLIDRGPAPIECIKLMLPGNHELMMLMAMLPGKSAAHDKIAVQQWIGNGGGTAITELVEKGYKLNSAEDLNAAFEKELPDDFIETMLSRSHLTAGDLLFVHAGIHPIEDPAEFLARDPFEHNNWAWIRNDFLDYRGGWDETKKRVVVHGHTPWEQDYGSTMQGAMSERMRAWKEGEVLGMDSTFDDTAGADMVESHRRINLDSGCGKFTTSLPFAEFWDGQYRLHIVTPS
ncbi:metallophosphoesterase [Salipiger sp. PrR003]|uniref:metallophosphoesterase n=1 Tax=Salipiger sp. PrR003 TaxID=2706776 RepID=UPI0013DBAE55|nr:metallophosphoesterase [Salipiger sp. PrR003]NDV50144.1 hypothetical protein [Salipiger sp. PrR003]